MARPKGGRRRSPSPRPSRRHHISEPVFRFEGRGDQYRPTRSPPRQPRRMDERDSYRPRRDSPPRRDSGRDYSFSFRSDIPAPQFPSQASSNGHRSRDAKNHKNTRRGPYFGQRNRKFAATHDRPIIQALREGDRTPERLTGMTDGPARFRDLAELSESMDESDSSESRDADPTGDSPRKRQKTESATELIVTSKWSNPDPYTVLPPAGEQLRGRKTDVVQLIRKAKITASEANSASRNDISGNMDFVPLDFGSEPEDEIESGEVPDDEIMQNLAYENSTESQTLASRIKRVNGGTATYTFGEGQKSGSDNGFLASEDISDHHTFSAVDASITSRIEQSTAINTTVLVESFPTRSGQLRDSRKRKLNLTHDGDIVQDWLAMSENIKAPWLTIDHSETNHMGLWLHKEICDFYEYVKPKPHEERIRQHIVSRISDALHQHPLFRRTNIRSFGSFASGLYLPTADMDLVLNSSQYERTGERTLGQTRVLWTAASQIEKAGISSGKVQVISRARVPIIKFVDSITRVKVDISFDNSTGIIANQTLQEWKAQFPALLPLIAIIKQFLLMRNLNEVQFGGLGGFSITCLVTSLLQHHPAIQSGKMIPEHHLGQLLIEFFDLYGNKFNLNTTGITMRPPSYFPKFNNPNKWTIIDPNKQDNDISGGSNKAPVIKAKFSDACNALRERMSRLNSLNIKSRRGESILGCILSGNFTSFAEQREHFRTMQDKA